VPLLPSSNNFYEYHWREAPSTAILKVTENFNALLRDIGFTEYQYLRENESDSTFPYSIRPR
jgi:hypothetical protein